jgi:hypothetical protein
VPVIGYKTNEFPAFFTPRSGFQTSGRLDTPEEFAKLIGMTFRNDTFLQALHLTCFFIAAAQGSLGIPRGIVVAVPINEKDAAQVL